MRRIDGRIDALRGVGGCVGHAVMDAVMCWTCSDRRIGAAGQIWAWAQKRVASVRQRMWMRTWTTCVYMPVCLCVCVCVCELAWLSGSMVGKAMVGGYGAGSEGLPVACLWRLPGTGLTE